MINKKFIIFLLSFHINMIPVVIKMEDFPISSTEKKIKFSIHLEADESIQKQGLLLSSDSPNIMIENIVNSGKPTKKYLSYLQKSEDIFDHDFIIEATIKAQNNNAQGYIHLNYIVFPQTKTEEQQFAISFQQIENNQNELVKNLPNKLTEKIKTEEPKSITEQLQNLVQKTTSNWIRFLFAFLLGLLLSLTPCIYPMIPITIGILHHHEKRSLLQNFFGSLCYAFGLSTTFASLGLLAAFAGASFGSLLSQPIFVVIITCFIGYMSLTMIGIIDLKIPSFLNRSVQTKSKFGPYFSAFIFGLISGSIASPCVSPGLALLLTLVATMGNVFYGFLLLFLFGIGMSTPLIIIGTFSSSMQMLPQAGQWMVEIKKALGFVMLATCLYYLNNILPSYIIILLVTAYLLFAAFFYIIDAQKDFNKTTKTIKSLIGITLLAFSILYIQKSYNIFYQKNEVAHNANNGVIWATNYQEALHSAQSENKFLLLDFWANHCSICKAIDKKIFSQNLVKQELENSIVFFKVDCTHGNNNESTMLKNKYQIFAQPAILIIDPKNEMVLKKWSSEPYSMSPVQFIETVKALQ